MPHLSEERLFDMACTGTAITLAEIAQAVRHEARSHLQTCVERLALLSQAIKAGRAEEIGPRVIDGLSEDLHAIANTLDHLRTLSRPPTSIEAPLPVDNLWHHVFGLVAGRLQAHCVSARVSGTAMVTVAPNRMHLAFLNLILNSLDAFSHSRRKARYIRVAIEACPGQANDITMRYVDNAGGIDPANLRPSLAEGTRSITDVFVPGVTSKIDGAGYGLYLVRKIIHEHNGTIEIVDNRGGVSFQITLRHSRQD